VIWGEEEPAKLDALKYLPESKQNVLVNGYADEILESILGDFGYEVAECPHHEVKLTFTLPSYADVIQGVADTFSYDWWFEWDDDVSTFKLHVAKRGSKVWLLSANPWETNIPIENVVSDPYGGKVGLYIHVIGVYRKGSLNPEPFKIHLYDAGDTVTITYSSNKLVPWGYLLFDSEGKLLGSVYASSYSFKITRHTWILAKSNNTEPQTVYFIGGGTYHGS